MSSWEFIAVYPGSFDPITLGHIDIARRAARLFPRVIVAVSEAKHKVCQFSLGERLFFAQESLSNIPNVEITSFHGLLSDFVSRVDARAIIRGLRAVSDFEYEFKMAWMNRRLAPGAETIFLIPSEEFAYLSSSLVKEIAAMGGDVSSMVPEVVARKLMENLEPGHD
ncbi:MAG: pantetheine-phosphate adenylyltransferase [Candidatus Hydrothermia bacterium]